MNPRQALASTGKLVLLLLATHAAWAQYVISTRAGTIHYIRGQVSVDGQPLKMTPLKFPLLKEGQVLRTGAGRAEILLGPGVFLRLGEHGAVRMLDTRLENAEVEVQQGAALVEVVEMPNGSDVHVVSGPTRTGFKGIGLHRFEAGTHELRVFGGHAEVIAAGHKAGVGRGQVVHLEDALSVSRFDPHRKDALHLWAARRSFLLFRSNRSRRTNWEVSVVRPASTKAGLTTDQDRTFFSNRDFGVMFYSQMITRPHAASDAGHGDERTDSVP